MDSVDDETEHDCDEAEGESTCSVVGDGDLTDAAVAISQEGELES